MSAETVQVVDLEPIPPVGGDTRDEEGAAPPAIEELRDESGLLQIGVRPWAAVTIDGRPIGETPIAPLALAPGIYTARLEHPGYRPLVRKVTVHSGETVRLQVDLGLDGIKREPVPRRER